MADEKVMSEVLVEDKAMKEGAKGDYFEFKLEGRTYRWFPQNDEEKAKATSIKKGDTVKMTYVEVTKGEYTYKNVRDMTIVEVVGKKKAPEPRSELAEEEIKQINQNTVNRELEKIEAMSLAVREVWVKEYINEERIAKAFENDKSALVGIHNTLLIQLSRAMERKWRD